MRGSNQQIRAHISNWIPAYAGMTKIFPLSRFTVSGNSMLPTLKPGQDILCFNWAYFFSKPKKGDVVVFRKNGKDMIKRIQKLLDREVFVQGDNGKESTDSRNFGPVDKSQLVGKIIWP